MPADMQLQVVASLLRRGRSLDQLSTGLTLLGVLFGLAQLLMVSITPICLLLSLWMIILGLLQKYWALRVAFDADLFALMAKDIERTGELDQTLQTLGLQPVNRASRPWTERRRGALKLLRKQAYLLGAQVLLTLAVILASPWLPFAG
ncbi:MULTISPECIES: hypothetical protein [Pseudomonas]|jgi:hypothetical protein|uniref:Uncharacterized protein n=1 Tax=Pseudomonas shahriarae TaxID=2745512 RepID=A0ABT5NIJ7_9PSED|nr:MULTISPECIES: hypothetical protein [Pseudomonas]SUD47392.1 Uncharacterised protein [Pseudomonas fluorescens]MDD0981770.1 hypothetical protein [Pseudomonas shahriarae]MDD0988369.1 hypothetical protein [Pseudomonas shahriarae]MDD1035898.1 hypothetical protein [Pseudomonas shahriarae]NMY85012.1 hypothetical protein [Pseudomonas sp. WS 5411]